MTKKSLSERALELAEGNTGAIVVAAELHNRGRLALLEASGIRGPAVWEAFKDVCAKDYDILILHLTQLTEGKKP